MRPVKDQLRSACWACFGKVPAELQSFSAHVVQRVRSMCVLASVTGAVAAICDVLYACCVEHA